MYVPWLFRPTGDGERNATYGFLVLSLPSTALEEVIHLHKNPTFAIFAILTSARACVTGRITGRQNPPRYFDICGLWRPSFPLWNNLFLSKLNTFALLTTFFALQTKFVRFLPYLWPGKFLLTLAMLDMPVRSFRSCTKEKVKENNEWFLKFFGHVAPRSSLVAYML